MGFYIAYKLELISEETARTHFFLTKDSSPLAYILSSISHRTFNDLISSFFFLHTTRSFVKASLALRNNPLRQSGLFFLGHYAALKIQEKFTKDLIANYMLGGSFYGAFSLFSCACMAPGVSISIGGVLVTGVYLPLVVLASEIFMNMGGQDKGVLATSGLLEQDVNDLGVAKIASCTGSGLMGFLAYMTFVNNDQNLR